MQDVDLHAMTCRKLLAQKRWAAAAATMFSTLRPDRVVHVVQRDVVSCYFSLDSGPVLLDTGAALAAADAAANYGR